MESDLQNNLKIQPDKMNTSSASLNSGGLMREKKRFALWAVAALLAVSVLSFMVWRMFFYGPGEEGVRIIEKNFPVEETGAIESHTSEDVPGLVAGITPGRLDFQLTLRDEEGNLLPVGHGNRVEIRYPGTFEDEYYPVAPGGEGSVGVILFPLWPPITAGTVYIRVYETDDTATQTSFEWPGVWLIDNASVSHGELSASIEFSDFNLAQAERIIYMAPSGETQEYGEEFNGSVFTISNEDLQDGDHTILIKMPNDDRWHFAVLNYPVGF
ncbi:MAG: hypothetical protein WD712_02760 [Candidatus Spechtbacterales bacterium]